MVPQGYKFFWGTNCSNGVRLATLHGFNVLISSDGEWIAVRGESSKPRSGSLNSATYLGTVQ